MTDLETHAAAAGLGTSNRRLGDSAADGLTARLHDAAGRMVPSSEHKILLRAAASVIQRLEAKVRHGTTEKARLTAELKALRAAVRNACPADLSRTRRVPLVNRAGRHSTMSG